MSNHDIFNFIQFFFTNATIFQAFQETLATLLNYFIYKTGREPNTFLF